MSLTIQTILDAAAVLGDAPKVGIYSHRLFLPDRTITFRAADGEVFHIAHPAFWAAALREVTFKDAVVKTGFLGRPLWGLPLVDLDANEPERIRVMAAMAEAVPRWEHKPDPTPRHRFPWRLGPDAV